MMNLQTNYLGLQLANPLVAASSPLTGNLDDAKRLEDAGIAAIVMPSLFEEAIQQEQQQLDRYVHMQALGHAEAESYQPVPADYTGELDGYLELLAKLKDALGIPVIASLNGVTDSGWLDYGSQLVQAGADALELNVYYVASDPAMPGSEVEDRHVALLEHLRGGIHVPVAMKLTSQFSSVANMVRRLEDAGARGAVLFNRFYQPDIDLETLEVKPQLALSEPMEALLRIRWIAMIRGRVDLSLAATGGFHDIDAVLKVLLAGADAVYLCSVLLENGPGYTAQLLTQLDNWLVEYEYESVKQMQGSVSQQCALDPAMYEHGNYMKVIKGYRS